MKADPADTDHEATDTRARIRRAAGVKYSDKIARAICYRLASGQALKAICRSDGMPTFQSVLRWVNDNPEFAKTYAIACDMRAQCIADEILEIADTTLLGKRVKTLADGSQETVTLDQVERSKLRVDVRKWLLARLAPKRYGDRLMNEITGADGGPIAIDSTRPSVEAVSEFSSALFEGYRTYEDETTGKRADLDQSAIASLSELVSNFASGGDCHGQDPGYTGRMFAKGWFIRQNLRPPASFNGDETDPAS